MWIAGVMQGLMWRATNADGTLTYTFVESLKATYPYYVVRLGGGVLFLIGMFIMLYNVVKTVSVPASPHRAVARAGRLSRGGTQHESRNRRKEGLADGHADRHRHQRRRIWWRSCRCTSRRR